MNKITSIHLNGKAYQLEEDGHQALQAYLAQAEKQLQDDPDKIEILADLEQAIAEKIANFLHPGKDVLLTSEVQAILEQMGPVDGQTPGETSGTKQEERSDPKAPKRLYLIREGALFAGVCNGLAAYFNIDVLLVRIAFVGLTILTGGAWIAVYAALMFFVPYANTTEERAEAHGDVFNAQEVINRAKESYARLTDKEGWKQWKYGVRAKAKTAAWRERFERHTSSSHHGAAAPTSIVYPPRTAPFLGFICMILAVLWIAALLSLIQTGAIFGWAVTAYIPLWAAIILLFVVYYAVTGPMRARRWIQIGNQWHTTDHDAWHGVADGLGVLFLVICAWLAYIRIPEVHTFINHLPELMRGWTQSAN